MDISDLYPFSSFDHLLIYVQQKVLQTDKEILKIVFLITRWLSTKEKSSKTVQIIKGFLNKDFLFLGDIWELNIKKSQLWPAWGSYYSSQSERPQTESTRHLLGVCHSNSKVLRHHILVYSWGFSTVEAPKDHWKKSVAKAKLNLLDVTQWRRPPPWYS